MLALTPHLSVGRGGTATQGSFRSQPGLANAVNPGFAWDGHRCRPRPAPPADLAVELDRVDRTSGPPAWSDLGPTRAGRAGRGGPDRSGASCDADAATPRLVALLPPPRAFGFSPALALLAGQCPAGRGAAGRPRRPRIEL